MGVPELLKFAAKAPGALSRIRQSGTAHTFDYVMIDGTNVMQTVGVDSVVSLLASSSISVTQSVFILLDSQRDRTGTAREQRSHLSSHTLDVAAQQLCSSLSKAMKAKGVSVFLSGRDVEGEADFKILHLHRGLTTAAKIHNKPIPTFLFISEDSDLLAGALCGPAPNSCWIATRLRDATQELCLLSVEIVTAWLTGVGKGDIAYNAPPVVESSAPDAEEPVRDDEAPVESRHKKDGPMVGMGTAIYFADSDDEGDNAASLTVSAAKGVTPKNAEPLTATATVAQKDRAQRQQSAGIDLILLFLLLKGSGYLSPVIKGATKVDMSSIWSSYMQLGRNIVGFEGNSIWFDGAGLSKVLQSSHLFDSMSRPANTDEISAARKYLVAVTKTLVRGMIAFRGPRGAPEMVDGRSDQIVEPPTLAAFYALLDQPSQTRVALSVLFPPMAKPVANPIEESMMLLGDGAARPTPAPHALPTLKVAVVQMLSTASMSELAALFLDITLREALAENPATEVNTGATGSAFSFDLRRMVAVDAPRKQQSLNAVLAAAGLSTGYSYAVDPAKVLARTRPNMKQPALLEATSARAELHQAQTESVATETKASVAEREPKNKTTPKGPQGKKPRGATPALLDGAKDARKGKRRMGKKERVMMAKKLGKEQKA